MLMGTCAESFTLLLNINMWTSFVIVALGVLAAKGQDPCDTSNPPPVITQDGSVIESPGLAQGAYPPNSLCEWRVDSPSGAYDIVLTFSIFVVEDCTDCNCDYLELYDGTNDTAALLGRFCGSLENTVVPVGVQLFMRFVSDASVNGQGFSTTVSFRDRGCTEGADIVDGSGFIFTPGYPAVAYPANAFCSWRVRSTDPDMRVQLVLNDFNLEDGCQNRFQIINDYVRFVDNGENVQLGYWYGSMGGEGFSYTSYSNDALLTFNSDGSLQFAGFNISYSFVPGPAGS